MIGLVVVEKDVSKGSARSSVQTLVVEFFKIMLEQVPLLAQLLSS